MDMPKVTLADGTEVFVPRGLDGLPDWSGIGQSAPPPAPAEDARVLSVLEFRRRFSLAEKSALYTAAAASPLLRAWLDDLAAAAEVHLDHQDVVDALDWLVQAGILTPERAAVIRA